MGSWQPGQFFIDVKTRQRSVTLKGCGQLLRPAYVKIKTTKIYSEVNTAFSRNFAPAKISRYTVWLQSFMDTPQVLTPVFLGKINCGLDAAHSPRADVTHMHDEIKLTRPFPISCTRILQAMKSCGGLE